MFNCKVVNSWRADQSNGSFPWQLVTCAPPKKTNNKLAKDLAITAPPQGPPRWMLIPNRTGDPHRTKSRAQLWAHTCATCNSAFAYKCAARRPRLRSSGSLLLTVGRGGSVDTQSIGMSCQTRQRPKRCFPKLTPMSPEREPSKKANRLGADLQTRRPNQGHTAPALRHTAMDMQVATAQCCRHTFGGTTPEPVQPSTLEGSSWSGTSGRRGAGGVWRRCCGVHSRPEPWC